MWKRFDFWKDIIKYEINEEMIKQKKFNMFNKENEEYKFKRMNSSVKSQLNTYLFNMISFGVDNIIMNNIISYFKNYYFLEKNIVDSLYNIIKNFSENINEIENNIIERNKDETISDLCTKNETITNDNEENDEHEILRNVNVTFNSEGSLSNNLVSKQPCDNYLKAKRRQKKEKIEKTSNNQNKNDDLFKENQNLKQEISNNKNKIFEKDNKIQEMIKIQKENEGKINVLNKEKEMQGEKYRNVFDKLNSILLNNREKEERLNEAVEKMNLSNNLLHLVSMEKADIISLFNEKFVLFLVFGIGVIFSNFSNE